MTRAEGNLFWLALGLVLSGVQGCGADGPLSPLPEDRRWLDLAYAAGSAAQRLDLYLPPEGEGPFPLLVWIHGGGWRGGDKLLGANGFQLRALQEGYALASLNYRLSQEAAFPAQIHDVKTAIRWLREHRREYRLSVGRIGAWGSSAGGHLVALLGTSGGVEALEGEALGSSGGSSRVQAVVDWYGPTDLLRIAEDAGAQGCSTTGVVGPNSAITLLLGASVLERPDLGEAASPTTYLSSDDPPYLIQHGTRDCTVPFAQSQHLEAGLESVIGPDEVDLDLFDAGHGGTPFRTEENLQRIFGFFRRHVG